MPLPSQRSALRADGCGAYFAHSRALCADCNRGALSPGRRRRATSMLSRARPIRNASARAKLRQKRNERPQTRDRRAHRNPNTGTTHVKKTNKKMQRLLIAASAVAVAGFMAPPARPASVRMDASVAVHNQTVVARLTTTESCPPRHRREASSMAWRWGLLPLVP